VVYDTVKEIVVINVTKLYLELLKYVIAALLRIKLREYSSTVA